MNFISGAYKSASKHLYSAYEWTQNNPEQTFISINNIAALIFSAGYVVQMATSDYSKYQFIKICGDATYVCLSGCWTEFVASSITCNITSLATKERSLALKIAALGLNCFSQTQ